MSSRHGEIIVEDGTTTPPPRTRSRTSQNLNEGTPGARRSDRLRQKVAEYMKDETKEAITTPRGSTIHSLLTTDFHQQPTPRRVELDRFKRRLQFQGGVRSNVMGTDMYKALERNAKIEEFRQDQRGKRDSAQFKSRGLSLPAVSKKRETSIIPAQRPGDTPSVVFVPRRSLRPRPWRTPTGDDITQALPRGSVELRKTQYKRLKVQQQVEFANWKDRDDAWRTKRLANYMTSTKLAREAALFKKRKLEICGWGNPQKNLGNYLSICWDYNPDLDADKAQKLPGRPNILLKRVDAQGGCVESGYLYKPETVENEGPSHINGYCFTVQSELAFTYEPALRNLFLQASDLVQKSFFQYNMDLSLDSSLDDNFTVEVFVMDLESPMNSVRGVTQFVLMKGYIYVDKICVKHEFQRTGIGYYMMTRIFELAEKRKKDVLLYALGPVVKLYQKWGFKYCKEWPAIEKDIGVIMRKRVATKHVVDDFVGLEWDGTKFC